MPAEITPERVAGVLLITAICGMVDAVCFLALGGVFAEIMTGNLLLMAFSIGTGTPVAELGHYVVAIASFAVGAVWGGRLLRSRHPLTWRMGESASQRHGLLIEWLLVAAAVVVALALAPSDDNDAARWTVGLLAMAMGIQNATMRVHGVPDIATNVMTLTFTGVLSDSGLAGGANPNWRRRAGSVAVFVASAALGAFLLRFGVWVPLALALAMLTAALPLLGVRIRGLAAPA